MDWSQVTSLTIPEGSVKQVSVNGVTLWRKSSLPTFVEYIEFDGNSWIDTGYMPSSNTRVVGSATFTQWNGTSANYVFGVFGDSKNFGFNVGSARGYFNIPWATNPGISDQTKGIEPTFNVKYKFDISKEGCYINNVEYLNTSKLTETFQAQKTMFVGWANGTSAKQMIGKVAPIQIFESNVLIQDLRPCIDPEGVVCFYDMVTKRYFYNQGTGTFGTGLPSDYTRLEYIQNDSNSYIKTGVLDGTDDMSYEADFTYISGSDYQYVLGAHSGDDKRNTVLYINRSGYIGGWINKAYSQDIMTSGIVSANKRIKCYADSTKFVVNDVTKTKFSDGTQRAGAELYLFRRNGDDNGYAAQTVSNAIIRLHSLTIKIKNVAVRNFIPAMRNSNGEVGLYDTVTKQFFNNAGTGTFTTEARFTDYIEFDGESYIDTGVVPVFGDKLEIYANLDNGAPVKNYALFSAGTGDYQFILLPTTSRKNYYKYFETGEARYFKSSIVGNFEFFANGSISVDGTQLLAPKDLMARTVNTTMFIGCRANNTAYWIGKVGTAKLISSDGTVKFDLRPALDSNNVACMYDKVTGKYLYNQGTGTLTAGNFVPPPKEYVDYIDSDGNSYIDSGIECTSDLKIKFKGSCPTNVNKACCGGIDMRYAPTYFRYHWTPTRLPNQEELFGFFCQNDAKIASINDPHIPIGTVVEATIDAPNGTAVVNGTKRYFIELTGGLTTGKGFGVFARISNAGDIQSRPSRFYYFKIYKNDVLVRDLRPCIDPEGVVCMYDMVHKKYFYNQGTGTFTAGRIE